MKIQRGFGSKAKYLIAALFIAVSFLFCFSCDFSFKGKDSDQKEEGTDEWKTVTPLKDIYKDYFLMGNIISPRDLNDATRFGIIKRHYSIVTAENDMKPENLAPLSAPASETWNYRFSNADTIVAKAKAEGLVVHGHTLVWHSQTPSWLTTGSKDAVLANLEKYITDVAKHFEGKLISWDVVNEAMRDGLGDADAANWTNCLRLDNTSGQPGSAWNRIIGPEYIEKAFLAARAADPDVKLYYNDYNLNDPNKARAVYNMVKDINNRHYDVEGRPLIDGIGMQSHHNVATNPQSVETSIKLFVSLGVEVGITELDIVAANGGGITIQGLESWSDTAAQKQAQVYAAMFRIFKNYAQNISRVTFWGIDDGTSWRRSNYPTLMNNDYSLKPAFYAVADPSRY